MSSFYSSLQKNISIFLCKMHYKSGKASKASDFHVMAQHSKMLWIYGTSTSTWSPWSMAAGKEEVGGFSNSSLINPFYLHCPKQDIPHSWWEENIKIPYGWKWKRIGYLWKVALSLIVTTREKHQLSLRIKNVVFPSGCSVYYSCLSRLLIPSVA